MLLYYSKRTILAASRMLNSSFRRLNSFLPKKEGPSSVILKVLFIYYTVHIISHAGPLPVCEEFVIDSLLNYRTVFSRCIDQQYQVLSLAVMVHDITVAIDVQMDSSSLFASPSSMAPSFIGLPLLSTMVHSIR